MKQAFFSLLTVSLFITSNGFADENAHQNAINEVAKALAATETLKSCIQSPSSESCQEATFFLRSWDVEQFEPVLNKAILVFREAVTKDEEKLH